MINYNQQDKRHECSADHSRHREAMSPYQQLNDENVASLKKHTQFKTKCKSHCLARSTTGRNYPHRIAQFRIPGRTGASCVKHTKVRLMRGRNKSTKALEMVEHHWCAFNCTNITQKQKKVEKYPVHSLKTTQISIMLPIPERERRMRGIKACRLDSLNLTRHTRICSVLFEGGIHPTELNSVPSSFAFPQHLQRKPPKSRTDPEERRRN